MLQRLVIAAGAALLVLSAAVPAVMAGRPSRDYLATPDYIEFGAGEACAFPVRVDFLVNKEYGMTFSNAEGTFVRQLIAGQLIISLTNTSNGRSITVDISGPGQVIAHADGSSTFILRGNSLPVVPGRLYTTTGTVVQELDADGNLLSTSTATGTENDRCPSLT